MGRLWKTSQCADGCERRCCGIPCRTRTIPPRGASVTDAVGRRPTKACHPIQDVASEQGLGLSPRCRPGSQLSSDDRLVPEDRVLHAGLPMVSRILLPPSTAEDCTRLIVRCAPSTGIRVETEDYRRHETSPLRIGNIRAPPTRDRRPSNTWRGRLHARSITRSSKCGRRMRIGNIRARPNARPLPHRRIDHPHSHPGKQISIRSRRFVPRVPERWADVRAGFLHRGARRACPPRTQRCSGWVVEEDVVVGDLRGQVSASWEERRRSCGTGLWDRMRQPQMPPQESRNYHRVCDQRNQRQASSTPRTGEHI